MRVTSPFRSGAFFMSGLFAQTGLGEVLAIGASLSYSISLIGIRQGVRSATPITGVLILNATVAVLGFCIAASLGTLQKSMLVPVLLYLIGGCLGQGIGQITNAIGIEKMGVSRSVPIQSSTPIFSVTFAMIFLGERPGAAVGMGTLLIVAGVCLLSAAGRRDHQSFKRFFRGSLVYPLASAVSYGVLPVLANYAFSYQRTPIVGFSCAFASGTLLLLATRPLLPGGGELKADARAIRWFLFAALTTTAAAVMFWTAMSIAPVSTVLPLSRLVPLWVVLWTYLFLGSLERITSRVFMAALMVVGGGVLITAFK